MDPADGASADSYRGDSACPQTGNVGKRAHRRVHQHRVPRFLAISVLLTCLMASVSVDTKGLHGEEQHDDLKSFDESTNADVRQQAAKQRASRFQELQIFHDRPPQPAYAHFHQPGRATQPGGVLSGEERMDVGEAFGAQLSPVIRNSTNSTMRLGMELKYGDWLLDVDFVVAFNSSNFSNHNCLDRGARCLPAELRYQMNEPSSRLFRVLQNGRFARLLASNSDLQNSGLISTHYLFERRQRSRASRTLLQAPVPEFEEVQKSQELLLLQVSMLLGMRQIANAPEISALRLLYQV